MFVEPRGQFVGIKELLLDGFQSKLHIVGCKPRVLLARLLDDLLGKYSVEIVGKVRQKWNDMCIEGLHHHKCTNYLRKVGIELFANRKKRYIFVVVKSVFVRFFLTAFSQKYF